MVDGYETGRPADIEPADIARVTSYEDVAGIVEQMCVDLREHPGEWENHTLDRYLEALAAFLDGLPSLYDNRGEPLPDPPTWRMVAEALVAATGYE